VRALQRRERSRGTAVAVSPAMRSYTLFIMMLCTALTAACSEEDTKASVSGAMRYDDASTDASGNPREAEAPPPGTSIVVTVEVRGTGTLEGLEPQCLDGASGQFHALFDGAATVDDDGAYVAAVGEGGGQIETLSGCAVPELTVGVITDIVVRAEIDATTASCSSYCEASARSSAEAECAGNSDQAGCRAAAESSASASCNTECTTQRDVIVAEASLAASLLGDLDAEALKAAALGDFTANLTFDHME